MRFATALFGILLFVFCLLTFTATARAQNAGNSTSVGGTVTDPSGAVIPGATVTMHNPVSGFERTATTDASGDFSIANVPFNPYHLTAAATGFATNVQDVDVRSSVPISLKISLQLGSASSVVTVEAAGDLLETDSTFHTDVDRALFDKLPLESASSSVSSLVTLSTPGVAADSNGLFHGLGDHAENSFSVDGQPITDQQSKVFSNQIPVDAIQSMEVISGAPPAEYGDKTSLVIDVTTRSGQGMTTPHGTVTADYGSFGTVNGGFNLGYGGEKWGNFISANGLNTGRFLDPAEFVVMHDKGNEENVFDRFDYQLSTADSIHLNLGYSRSWFQNPNSFDQQFHDVNGVQLTDPVTGNPLGPTDQRSQIKTFNISPTWTRLIGSNTVFTLGGFVRRDQYNYYPSANPFDDFSPDLQGQTVVQNRKLTNAGVRSNVSYVKGIHNLKAGVTYEQTFLTEDDGIGIVDPGLVTGITPSCLDAVTHQPLPGTPCAILAPYDLTGGGGLYARGSLFTFDGHTDVKQLALFVEDAITKGNWNFNLGIRGDLYNGLSIGRQAEPRLGIAYNIKPSNTVLRVSYARSMETPFNENLVIASTGCSIPFLATLVPPPGVPCNSGSITPGYRNEFHAGLQQAFGRYLVVDGEYIWKETHGGYDFGTVGSTPITFPIEWHNAKIPGYAIRVSVPNYRGFSAQVVMSSVAARFFLPQVAGLPIVPPATGVFRIDHDEKFNETTHFQYQPWKTGPWLSFNWRYDSGLVAGATPCYNPLTATCAGASTMSGGQPAINMINTITGAPLTADQEFQAGFTCNGVHATPTVALPSVCLASQFGSTLIQVPAPGTENDDKNPQRIQPRSLFDLAVGDDNLFKGERYKWSARVTVINLTNKYALYNFLSTFSGTHYVTPRAVTGEIGFHF
ncbi:MAG TPA: TonB-dependent receptor [Candidatus Acidoferrales bacterium]|nr:TonB-dependent receptor [Candidatus Acidoferrales bacterium]